jgi:hypothetical protein
MRRVPVLLAALLLAAAACGDDTTSTTTAPSTSTVTTTPSATSLATTTTAPPTTTSLETTTTAEETTTTTLAPVTTLPGLPAAESRSLIPWSEVDEGWVVVRYDGSTTDLSREGPFVIYLVDPAGTLYEIRAFTTADPFVGELEAFANSGRQIALEMVRRSDFERRVASLSLESGLWRTVLLLPDAYSSLGTTLPSGRDIVVNRQDTPSATDYLEIYRTNGDLFASITSAPSGFPWLTWLYGLDGTFLVVGAGSALTVYQNDGTMVRDLTIPAGYCEPVRWWDATTILASCVPDYVLSANGYYHVLWLIPLDGSAGSALTAPPPPGWDVVEFGHADAWRAAATTLVQWYGDCGARGIQVLHPDTSTDWVSIGVGGSHWIHAQDGNNLIIHSNSGCGDSYGPVSLISPTGSLIRTLVPTIPGYFGVTSVAAMIPTP